MANKRIYFKTDQKAKLLINCKIAKQTPKRVTIRQIANELGYTAPYIGEVFKARVYCSSVLAESLCGFANVEFKDYF